MPTFNEIYLRLMNAAVHNATKEELEKIRKSDFDARPLDCLLHPDQYAPVWRIGECSCSDEEKANCAGKCLFDALKLDEHGNATPTPDLCVGCAACVDRCKAKHLIASKDVLPALAMVNSGEAPVYAIIAPAFISQFSEKVTPGSCAPPLNSWDLPEWWRSPCLRTFSPSRKRWSSTGIFLPTKTIS